ncbi:MAG: 30S ribosomal protein S13 [Canidatus Methanoxibalbensis ujae]|nr:30S ribosomal protein S13 [Candidatus Methanoxibalbensis ujae]MCW7077738.1 30S ribosomal protein S13 [Candidatus Methanoxibalbensis ujae]
MADENEGDTVAEDREEFRYIVRLMDTDLDGYRTVEHALCGIKGVGRRIARAATILARIDPDERMGNLSDDAIERLKMALQSLEKRLPKWMLNRRKDLFTGDDLHILGADLPLKIREDINFMRKIRCYRGIRHERGLKVRGQRTRSTGRKGPVVGVIRRKQRASGGKG